MAPARLILLAGAALCAVYAAGLFYEIDFAPGGCCGLTWPTPDPVVAERQVAAADPKGADAAAQRKAALDVLAARPGEPTAWLRLAYADRLAHGQLTAAGARAMDMSYLARPYIYHQTAWRIGFALDNWSRLTPDGRKGALQEIAIARASGTLGEVAAAVRPGPADPSGRLAAALLGLI